MSLPRVKFKKLDIEDNLDSLIYYLNPLNSKNSPLDFYGFTLKLFPELKGKIKSDMSDEEIYMVLDKEVRPTLNKMYENSSDEDEYQSIWDKVNDNILRDLEEKLDIKWNSEEITCRLCLLPVCSRDILGKTFDINYGRNKDNVIATGIHELCHILYFAKWMEIFPDYKEEEFDNPHIAWYLSEAMIDPLINNETFKKYTNDDLSAYTVFYEIFIDGKSIIDILREYVNNYSIEDAIKRGYELFIKYESIIKGND